MGRSAQVTAKAQQRGRLIRGKERRDRRALILHRMHLEDRGRQALRRGLPARLILARVGADTRLREAVVVAAAIRQAVRRNSRGS